MATALVLTDRISQKSQRITDERVIDVSYGDGYQQIVSKGLNSKYKKWIIKWEMLNTTEQSTAWTFLDTVGRTGLISWDENAGGDTYYWRITSEISETQLAGNLANIQFEITQRFDLIE